MTFKLFLKIIWTASPKMIYEKIHNLLTRADKSEAVELITINSGQAKNIKLVIPVNAKSIYLKMAQGDYENYLLESLLKHSAIKNKTIWDIGAHVGYHSLLFAKYAGPNGLVIAFEPNPKNREIFRNNLENNKNLASNIILKEEALADEIGLSKMLISRSGYQTSSSGGYLHDVMPPLAKESYKNFTSQEIKINTIDNLIKTEKLPIPDLMKVDVEGAELKVLEGALNTLRSKKPILAIEIHSILMMFYLQKLLLDLNYQLEIIDENVESFTKNILARPK